MADSLKVTPLMQQYFELRAQYPEALLLFQVGDFYELFFEDATRAAACLNITLTKRGSHQGEPIPLCGIPVHALDAYLGKLIKAGYRVAICDQLEEASPGKIVRRGVTRLLTPGTLVETNLLDAKSASYFCSFFPTNDAWGLVFGELLTSQLFATTISAHNLKNLESEIARFLPDEILLPDNKIGKQLIGFFKSLGYATALQSDSLEDEPLLAKFQDQVQSKLRSALAIFQALKNFYSYLEKCQKESLSQFDTIKFYSADDFLILDAATQRHLELVNNSYDGSSNFSLLKLLDHAATPMGSRLIRKWLLRPLIDLKMILARQTAVAELVENLFLRSHLALILKQVSDLERVVGRISLQKAALSDYLQLKTALLELPKLHSGIFSQIRSEFLGDLKKQIFEFRELAFLLESALNVDQSQANPIRSGFSAELDQMRDLVQHATQKIIELESKEQVATGITSLKIRYNQIQGYYIEITKPNLHLVPTHYLRHQTLVGKERFITNELQQLQSEINLARANIGNLEDEIFKKLQNEVRGHLSQLRKTAAALSQMDALLGLAGAAAAYGYIKPEFNQERQIYINQGRHPLVEQNLAGKFIPNTTDLNQTAPVWIITGPNMGGKSTYLRQVALICILAQCGSFVPASAASLPILDRIFTRIGANDYLARGQSTFLVEMAETATICDSATKNSLVILDEVGRGTSTFDGLAIAQAVLEYIYQKIGAFCLFATHYHELTVLPDRFSGIKNYHAASRVTQNKVILLHQILPGVANGSFGIEAARSANLAAPIIQRAEELLQELTQSCHQLPAQSPSYQPARKQSVQVSESELNQLRWVCESIQKFSLDDISPRQAHELICLLQKELQNL